MDETVPTETGSVWNTLNTSLYWKTTDLYIEYARDRVEYVCLATPTGFVVAARFEVHDTLPWLFGKYQAVDIIRNHGFTIIENPPRQPNLLTVLREFVRSDYNSNDSGIMMQWPTCEQCRIFRNSGNGFKIQVRCTTTSTMYSSTKFILYYL